jgi:hypothetical protein
MREGWGKDSSDCFMFYCVDGLKNWHKEDKERLSNYVKGKLGSFKSSFASV